MDVLHSVSPATASWSSVNLAEAVPGVMTPLSASVWVPASELGLRSPFRAMGVLTAAQAAIPADPLERITGAFYGRMAVRVDFLCEVGDLVPGQSGDDLARDFFGFVPDDFVSHPSNRRLPAVALRYPRTLATIGRRLERDRRRLDIWWRRSISTIPSMDTERVRDLLGTAVAEFGAALAAQAVVSACAIQLVQSQLADLAERAGVDPTDLLRGHGSHEESAVLSDLWAVSREQLSLPEFLTAHGYHCAGEGEVSAVTWREDPTPVLRLVARYADMPDTESPDARAAALAHQGADAERRLRTHSGSGRIRVAATLRLARRFIPLRGVGKVSYLQCLDVIRCCARRLGDDAVAHGMLGATDDIFYLTADELTSPLRADAVTAIADRRTRRLGYQSLRLPATWTGRPEPITASAPERGQAGTTLSGVGAAPGSARGRAVVVTDPDDAEIADGDILIAHTTDPTWVSLMFLASALVVDIGGMMSHAAVVARELDVPCVMNTGDGTAVIETGDIILVDGTTGKVRIESKQTAAIPD